MIINRIILKFSCTLILTGALLLAALPAQQDQQSQPEDKTYGSEFFEQLRIIFGRFRDADLQRVFQEAQPIQCSELVGRKGEWRPVAFFNEDRRLGDWCRQSLEEVKASLTVYTFTGVCSGNGGRIRVASEFPTAQGLEAYREGRIELDRVDVMMNDPVNAVIDPENMAYTFDLPYLFLTKRRPKRLYSFLAPDRNSVYATEVASRWECKAVHSKDVTYRFLICRVATVPRHKAPNQRWIPEFGSSAFFILSDGTEAKTSVNVSFGNATPEQEESKDRAPASRSPGHRFSETK